MTHRKLYYFTIFLREPQVRNPIPLLKLQKRPKIKIENHFHFFKEELWQIKTVF